MPSCLLIVFFFFAVYCTIFWLSACLGVSCSACTVELLSDNLLVAGMPQALLLSACLVDICSVCTVVWLYLALCVLLSGCLAVSCCATTVVLLPGCLFLKFSPYLKVMLSGCLVPFSFACTVFWLFCCL